MRIGIVHNYQLTGSGSCVYVRELAKALKLLGNEVFLFSREEKPDEFDFIDEAWNDFGGGDRKILFSREDLGKNKCIAITYRNLPEYVPYRRLLEPKAKLFDQMGDSDIYFFVGLMRDYLRECVAFFELDILVVNHALFLPYICSELEVPYVVVIHGTALAVAEELPRFKQYVEKGLRRAKKVVVLNRDVRSRVNFLLNSDLNNLVEIPIGVDVTNFLLDADDSFLRMWKISTGNRLLTFHGQLIKSKGVDLLIAAMPLILSKIDNLCLLIMGAGEFEVVLKELVGLLVRGDHSALELLCRSNGLSKLFRFFESVEREDYFLRARLLEERVIFTGYLSQDKLAKILPYSELVVVPSVGVEAFPLVIIESLACGVLPVAYYQSGLKEILDEIRNIVGIDVRVQAKNVCDLSFTVIEALKSLERFSKKRVEIREKLRDLVCEKYSWQVVGKKIFELLRE